MTNQQILEKAIQKAIDGGWKRIYKVRISFVNNDGSPRITPRTSVDDWDTYSNIIFDHDFAKALWGEELHHETFIVPKELSKRFAGTKDLDIKPVWQYHLQQMVIAKDPIKYLGENI